MIRRNNPYKRKDRVEQELRKAISSIIQFEMNDGRLNEITLTDISLSNDLKNAQIYISTSLSGVDKNEVLELLDNAKGYIKKNLSNKIKLRYMPHLHFKYDDSIDYGFKVDKLLKDLKEEG